MYLAVVDIKDQETAVLKACCKKMTLRDSYGRDATGCGNDLEWVVEVLEAPEAD